MPSLTFFHGLAITSLVIFSLATPFSYTSAQSVACSNGEKPATAVDVPRMIAAGIKNAILGMCWNANDPTAGANAGEAKQWLTQHASRNANISCLEVQFSERLKNLMMAVPGGPPIITDGYRGAAAQNAAKATGASKVGWCGSYHNYGMAADFNASNSGTTRWMRVNAARFGLAPVTNGNPVTGCTPRGFCDYGHIQMAGPHPPSNYCGQCANDVGNGALPPPMNVGQTPSSQFADQIRHYLQGNQNEQQNQQDIPNADNQLPPSSQPTFPGDTASTSDGDVMSAGNASTSDEVSNSYEPISSSITTDVEEKHGTSTEDLLNALANPRAAASRATGTPITLNQDLSHPIGVDAKKPETTRGNNTSSSVYAPLTDGNTFTSSDLGSTDANFEPMKNNTFLIATLEKLRRLLFGILAQTQPFGGTPISVPVSE